MTVADHEMVGAVGFAAWLSGGVLDALFKSPDIIASVRREFFIYPSTAKGEVIIASLAGSRAKTIPTTFQTCGWTLHFRAGASVPGFCDMSSPEWSWKASQR